jgi:hypothetical protein
MADLPDLAKVNHLSAGKPATAGVESKKDVGRLKNCVVSGGGVPAS